MDRTYQLLKRTRPDRILSILKASYLEQAALKLEFANGSRIVGIPEGADYKIIIRDPHFEIPTDLEANRRL